ncbi:MAG: hypothetical protein JSV86_06250 [Gemmatimonadota bacterium]|nr:MAG: hypothetical protein JSV86_06250 [Gemmatimonadota bacterium]
MYETTDAWNDLYDLALGTAAAHRATGGRTAAARADRSGAMRLPAWVTEETAQAAIHAEIATLDADTFAAAPDDETCRRVVTAATTGQARAAVSPMLATTETRWGERARHESLDAAADMGECDPEPDRERAWADAVQAVLDSVASLPDHHRDTVERLIAGKGAPSDVSPSAWKMRVLRARQAFAAAHASRTR